MFIHKEMNLSQKMMTLIKDYDCIIDYHLGEVNLVADALSRKTMSLFARMQTI